MLEQEFEGKTKKEAVENALRKLNLKEEEIKVETVTDQRKVSFFGFRNKSSIKIKVYYEENAVDDLGNQAKKYLESLFRIMDIKSNINILEEEENKIYLSISSNESGILIGKQGKNLEALQLLVNMAINSLKKRKQFGVGEELGREVKMKNIILDVEGYSSRRKEYIQKLSLRKAELVKNTHQSQLLSPMNPFERKLVHTTLEEVKGVVTKSEGEGRHKKVRIYSSRS